LGVDVIVRKRHLMVGSLVSGTMLASGFVAPALADSNPSSTQQYTTAARNW
jgi:hypothetical protein